MATTWYSGINKQLRTIRKNIFFWCLLFLLAFGVMVVRLLWLETVRHEHYSELGERYRHREVVLPAKRGRLLDRNTTVLALDDECGSLYIDPTLCTYPGEVKDSHKCEQFFAEQLAPVIQQTPPELLDAMHRQVPFVWVKRDLNPEAVGTLRTLGLPGLEVKADGGRYRIGIDPALAPPVPEIAAPLAEILHLPAEEVTVQLSAQTKSAEGKTGKSPLNRVVSSLKSHLGKEGKTPAPADGAADGVYVTSTATVITETAVMNANGSAVVNATGTALTSVPTQGVNAGASATNHLPGKPLIVREQVVALPAVQRWVRGVYPEDVKKAVVALHFPGIIFMKVDANYSLGVDPRVYGGDNPAVQANRAAAVLAPLLDLKANLIERRLLFRPRFAWLKRNLSEGMLSAISKLETTMFIVEPGKVLDPEEPNADPQKQMEESVTRLYSMLNDKKGPETISKAEIRRRLEPGSVPGPLAVRPDSHGNPSLAVQNRLYNKPIPGVVYGLPGVSVQMERRRHYPFGPMAAPTLGFVDASQANVVGAFGLERTQDETIKGINGREVKEVDGRQITIPDQSVRTLPTDGRDIQLTLDYDIQLAAESSLAKAVAGSHALGGECLVMDPANGEILAMASSPTWDANAPGKSTVPLVNPLVSNFYEPGSTFKLVAVMAALEEHLVRDGEIITNCTGGFPVGNHTIHEAHHAHGPVDCGRLLEQSCNIGAATLALKLGTARFVKWCDRLGFGVRTGIELAHETPGSLNHAHANVRITLANMGFGQSMAVTPLQMAAGYSVVANGGFLVQPHLVKARQLPDGKMEPVKVVKKPVCSPETAKLMRAYLERVVTKGTGDAAAIPGYLVGGKTGTAQKPGAHGYGGGKAIGSFIGVMPADKPRLVIIAIIDEPQGSHYGGVVAAPVVKEVGLQALRHLNIPPNPAMHGKDQRHQGQKDAKPATP